MQKLHQTHQRGQWKVHIPTLPKVHHLKCDWTTQIETESTNLRVHKTELQNNEEGSGANQVAICEKYLYVQK